MYTLQFTLYKVITYSSTQFKISTHKHNKNIKKKTRKNHLKMGVRRYLQLSEDSSIK